MRFLKLYKAVMTLIPLVFSTWAKISNALNMSNPKMIDKAISKFDKAVQVVLRHEGKLSLGDDDDRGGATAFGVSLRFLQITQLDLNQDGKVTVEDILTIDPIVATQIYKKYFWDINRYNEIQDSDIATKMLDMSVNMGAKKANQLLQSALNRIQVPIIDVDGINGSDTLGKTNNLINNGYKDDLLGQIKDNATHFYINLVADDPTLRKYLDGWLYRANS